MDTRSETTRPQAVDRRDRPGRDELRAVRPLGRVALAHVRRRLFAGRRGADARLACRLAARSPAPAAGASSTATGISSRSCYSFNSAMLCLLCVYALINGIDGSARPRPRARVRGRHRSSSSPPARRASVSTPMSARRARHLHSELLEARCERLARQRRAQHGAAACLRARRARREHRLPEQRPLCRFDRARGARARDAAGAARLVRSRAARSAADRAAGSGQARARGARRVNARHGIWPAIAASSRAPAASRSSKCISRCRSTCRSATSARSMRSGARSARPSHGRMSGCRSVLPAKLEPPRPAT